MSLPALRPGRRIEGISAVLMPFGPDDRPDWRTFRALVAKTYAAGLTPAVNMDTGYVNLLAGAERERALRETAEVSGGRRFVAGAFVEGERGEPAALYRREAEAIRARGGTPILFQCSALARATEDELLATYRRVAEVGPPLLAFELSPVFAPFGRIPSPAFFRGLLDLPAFVGLKHSSLDRVQELERLALRDRHRPDFKVYTGNDLAIDMVFYGSDYLLGLSAFAVEAFAARDRLWAAEDARALAVNDALQALGAFAFRAPVPAYKHSAAQFLHLRGVIPCDRPHPAGARRPASDVAVLAGIAERLAAAVPAEVPA